MRLCILAAVLGTVGSAAVCSAAPFPPAEQKVADRIAAILAAHPKDLGSALDASEELRKELVKNFHAVYKFGKGLPAQSPARKDLREWTVALIKKYPQYLVRQKLDLATQPYVASVAYQTWTVLMLGHDGDPDAKSHRKFVADTIGYTGRIRDILIDFGTLLIENGSATPNQQETVHSYLLQIPPILLGDRKVDRVTEVITIGDYLDSKKRLDVQHGGGVNVFATESGKKGASENPFPKDFPAVQNDYFGLVLAHELNHRVDYTRFFAVPRYNEKYWDHMQKACGPDVVYLVGANRGVDWPATKKKFQDRKFWDGDPKTWDAAWKAYWVAGDGKAFVPNTCRSQLGPEFFLRTRQESVASLANQYFTDSAQMFAFALARYDRGFPGCLDEWLLMADVYSLGKDSTLGYLHPNGEIDLRRRTFTLGRNAAGHINQVKIDDTVYDFDLDAKGLVEQVRGRPKKAPPAPPKK